MRRLLLLLAAAAAAITHAQSLPRILLFTATAPGAYRHSSIDTAVSTIQTLCEGRWEAIVSDDAAVMGQLQGYSVVVGVMNTDVDPPAVGPLLTASQAASLADYIERGGSFLGIHSAANCNYGVPWYGRLVGAFFDYHAPVQNVTVRALTREHESTRQWEGEVGIYEEMYHFRTDPRSLPSSATVLLTPASSYSDPGVNALGFRNGSEGTPQPLAWYREGSLLDVPAQGTLGGGLDDYQGGPSPRGGSGRSFYTSLGHDEGTWQVRTVPCLPISSCLLARKLTKHCEPRCPSFNRTSQARSNGYLLLRRSTLPLLLRLLPLNREARRAAAAAAVEAVQQLHRRRLPQAPPRARARSCARRTQGSSSSRRW
ncbi:hypothetical protein FA09DRAFT_137285 [Tilletiopsis washingtonensis]|uniref:ThuA-like domain-containing protein n=1 Tax=Tilletiopsis washingtonensis TaxID=58919 RepID=A0A316Z1M7_9BASI|nr:hypothetical protein FA09DRAFT_137285 [Tilletiopsis washingtonensis]PWN95690.1 hypothetical protein FA09DRAFT_137285 [Tilletiopsis washingtonensis]